MKDKRPLYLQIAEAVRQDLLEGRMRPGDALPTVREMAERWKCTPGTVQQAYKELARQGLAVSRPGQGTHIGSVPVEVNATTTPLRRAPSDTRPKRSCWRCSPLATRSPEIESAFRASLDRWRALAAGNAARAGRVAALRGEPRPGRFAHCFAASASCAAAPCR